MAQHNVTGKKGEELGITYLKLKGYEILETNWRYRHWEVDIIALKDDIVHFVEVKTRTSKKFGYPEEAVTTKKIDSLAKAAQHYLGMNPHREAFQYDILSILLMEGNKSPQYFFIEDIDLA